MSTTKQAGDLRAGDHLDVPGPDHRKRKIEDVQDDGGTVTLRLDNGYRVTYWKNEEVEVR